MNAPIIVLCSQLDSASHVGTRCLADRVVVSLDGLNRLARFDSICGTEPPIPNPVVGQILRASLTVNVLPAVGIWRWLPFGSMMVAKAIVAETCLQGAERGTKTFPGIDFRRAVATYYTPDGDTVEVPAHAVDVPVAQTFDADAVRAAIKEAQQLVPGYTYLGFCRTIVLAGCAGYFVSFLGRRVLYAGRTRETLVEPFPDSGT